MFRTLDKFRVTDADRLKRSTRNFSVTPAENPWSRPFRSVKDAHETYSVLKNRLKSNLLKKSIGKMIDESLTRSIGGVSGHSRRTATGQEADTT